MYESLHDCDYKFVRVFLAAQWGTLDYHRQTLDNIAEASRRTRKLCAVMIDAFGREIVVRRSATIGPDGWPVHEETMQVKSGEKVRLARSTPFDCLGATGASSVVQQNSWEDSSRQSHTSEEVAATADAVVRPCAHMPCWQANQVGRAPNIMNFAWCRWC